LLALTLFLTATVLAAAQVKPATLKAITFQKTETEIVAVIDCEGEFTYQTFEMSDPGRLVVEFAPVNKVLTEAAYDISAFGVTAVRTAQYQPLVARVVFDVPGKFPLYKVGQNQNQVVVTFSPPPAEAVEEAAAPAPPEAAVADLKDITFEKINDQMKIRILTEGAVAFQGSRLTQPGRLLLQFSPVERISAPPFVDINRSGLKRITIEKTDEKAYQVVFTLDENQPSFNITTAPGAVEVLFWQDVIARPAPAGKAAKAAVTAPTAAAVPAAPAVAVPFPNTQFGVLASSYAIASRAFSDVYGTAGWQFGAELSRILYAGDKLSCGASLAGRYFSKKGESTFTKTPTTLTLMPISLTANILLNGREVLPFLGIGVDRFGYKEKSDVHNVSGNTFGFHLQAGLFYRIPGVDLLALKFYAKFTQATAKQNDLSIKLGGTEFGLGLNLCFNLPKK